MHEEGEDGECVYRSPETIVWGHGKEPHVCIYIFFWVEIKRFWGFKKGIKEWFLL